MRVSVNGLGNIGTTLALILNKFKTDLGISEVIGYKNTAMPWQQTDLGFLQENGIEVIHASNVTFKDYLKSIDFVFDTTSNGFGMAKKDEYHSCDNLIGAIAQGSENGFGVQYMSGLPIDLSAEKLVQIASCNTHGGAALMALFSDHTLNNIASADFVVVRRSEDLGNHARLVSANVVARHLSQETGTHHAIDIKSMYQQIGSECPITSSDITTPSQLMHATRFSIQTKRKMNWDIIQKKIDSTPLLSTTSKFDSNFIFELGRRYGDFGRIYNHAIIVKNNLLKTDYSVKGWAFIPQEGNTIVSSIEAFLKMTQTQKASEIISKIQHSLCKKEW